ncbi:MAG TPA: GAF and ANTAR domain-containing protein [Acidimicrobiales bacterium]|nr:GAF and ANTAR domain-containing protein [Acidimicrobiales bacterium]
MSENIDPLVAGLDVLSEFFVDEGTVGDTLLRVAEIARQMVSADMAGITMMVEGRPRTGVYTDPLVREIDRAQYDTGDGPCIHAFHHQRVYRIDSTGEDDRWPAFSKDALARGVRSTLSVPLAVRGESMGAFNLYAKSFSAFDDANTRRVELFGRHAAIVLANSRVYWDARELNENLQQAMQSRAMIDQAVGILMASGRHGPDEAFQVLVRASQRENRKLRDIAEEIVGRVAKRSADESPT